MSMYGLGRLSSMGRPLPGFALLTILCAFTVPQHQPRVQKRRDVAQLAEGELSREQRKQRRAGKKRIQARKDAEREATKGLALHPKGLKSAREELAVAKAEKAARKAQRAAKQERGAAGGRRGGAVATSAGVFKQLEDERTAGGAAAAGARPAAVDRKTATSASSAQLRM